jgi:hypothetical protein
MTWSDHSQLFSLQMAGDRRKFIVIIAIIHEDMTLVNLFKQQCLVHHLCTLLSREQSVKAATSLPAFQHINHLAANRQLL